MRETNRPSDTRERLLDAAESLFMAHGYEGTSMRHVTSLAKVNLASVNYHFGSKEQLFQTVLRRRLDWLNDERLQALETMEQAAAGAPLRPAQVLDGFFGTLFRAAHNHEHGGTVFLQLLGRIQTEPSTFIRNFLAAEYAPVVDRYKEALFRSLPGLPPEEIVWRFHFMLGASSYAIAATDAIGLVRGGGSADDIVAPSEAMLSRLMAFFLAGLQAPPAELPG